MNNKGVCYVNTRFSFVTFKSGVTVINSTPHDITFMDIDGSIINVPSSCIINASVKETVVSKVAGVEYVKSEFVGSDEGAALIEKIHKAYPSAVIIGSIIAAQAYPGLVVGMTPCKGFERVPPNEKRMSTVKFTVF